MAQPFTKKFAVRNFSHLPYAKVLLLSLILLLGKPLPALSKNASLPLEKINLPDGFKIELIARVPQARQMTWGDCGTLFIGSFNDKVYALTIKDNHLQVIAKGLRMPVGVAFQAGKSSKTPASGTLFISSVDRIVKLSAIESRLDNPPSPEVIGGRFPASGNHGWKFIAFGPDKLLYVPIGAPCNICKRDKDNHSVIIRTDDEGKNRQTYSHGIRNSVGFDWHPVDQTLWFTNNGRDWLGDDQPPDTLHHAPHQGLDFGFPYCHAGDIPDPDFGRQAPGKKDNPCAGFSKPALKLGAHVAAIGMRFYTGKQFPLQYHNQIFIAEHGSWNRSSKVGYRITTVKINEHNQAVDYQPFATGWLQKESVWGRPADVLVAADGSLLVSDDYAGAIYRISYGDSKPWQEAISPNHCVLQKE